MKRSRFVGREALAVAGLVAAALVGTAPSAAGQAQNSVPLVTTVESGNPAIPNFDIRTVRRGFNLFANGDAASTGFKMTGNFGAKMDNYSPCSNTLYSCQNVRERPSRAGGGTQALWFQFEWAYGAPPSAFIKIKKVAPSIVNALGGGWSAGTNDQVLGRPNRIGPADGTLGKLFAGVTSTTDGSCRDFTGFGNASHPGGIPLLAGSGCPDTWPTSGWGGDAPVDGPNWKTLFDAQGAAFRFDQWRVPAANKRFDQQFLGTGWTTYGESSDHYQQMISAYGSVVPGGTGAPGLQGYPLGLELRFDAFTFGVPSVSGIQYIQTLIINRSQDVWGAPIDYDSLYFGMTTGVLLGSQNSSNYYIPAINTMLFHNSNAQGAGGPCDQAFRTPAGVAGCQRATAASRGYGNGAGAIIFLKSPLGDMRNKLFTRTNGAVEGDGKVHGATPCTVGVDPFCMPSHPAAGDTITYNRGGFGGYGSADAFTWGTGARASFGMISGTEDNTLAGRDPASQPLGTMYRTFVSPQYPAVLAKYNKYVPGNWDWNHDGIQDTLTMDTCNTAGCVAVDGDTVPAGLINRSGNVGGVMSFGPFKLKAGDTTSFVLAQIGGADSTDIWGQINAAIDLYQNFYLAPSAPPLSHVIATQVSPASDATGSLNPQVQFFWSEDAEHWVDPFLSKLAADMTAAGPGTAYGDLKADNPGIDTLVANLAKNNLQQIEIYKSCDGGATFTNNGDCLGNPTLDDKGAPVGLGWAPYQVFSVDGNGGNPPNVFTDNNVQGGKTYTYTIVGKSRGMRFFYNRRVSGTTDCQSGGNCVPDTLSFVGSIRNVLSTSTSDPNVASIYVPTSQPAGFQAAVATPTSGDARVTIPVSFTFTGQVAAGSYTGAFGNNFIVERDTTLSSGAVKTLVTVQDLVTADSSGTGVPRVVASSSFTRANHDVLPIDPAAAGVTTVTDTVVSGADSTIRTTVTYSGLGFAVANGSVPLWISIFPASAAASTPSTVFSLSDFPGFTVSAAQNLAGTFNGTTTGTQPETQIAGAASLARNKLPAADSIVPRGIVNPFMAQWSEASSIRVPTAGGVGVYEATWTADPFGTETGFVLNEINPSATESELTASLQGRAVGSTGLTDSITAVLTGVLQANLVAVKIPFTMKNITFGRDVMFAMAKRTDKTFLMGNGLDTIRVNLPDDQWVPGDQLFMLEDVKVDSTVGGNVVLDGAGKPIQVTHRQVTFSPAVFGCNTPRIGCNPVPQASPGASGYNPMYAGDRTRFEYYAPFLADSRYSFDIVAPVTGTAITQVTDSAMKQIRVVPNPFVVFSQYQGTDAGNSRLMFAGLPSRGTLRIYTVAGQFVQQITWDPTDLVGNGDLFYDLHTREGIDIATGLYLWVVTAPSNPNDPTSTPLTARGKFVVIRGRAQ